MTSANGGVKIKPIPPPLEFPYPNTRDATQANESQGHGNNLQEVETSPGPPRAGAAEDVATPGLLWRASAPSTRPPAGPGRHHTERRVPTRQRPSFLGLRRRNTGTPLQAYNPKILESDSESDSDSSSDVSSPDGTWGNRPKAKSEPARGVLGPNDKRGRRGSDAGYSKFAVGNEDYQTHGHVSKRDGRLKISLKETKERGYLAKAIGTTLGLRERQDPRTQWAQPEGPADREPAPVDESRKADGPDLHLPPPRLNIVIMVIGSRGDIQPFLRLGKVLHDQYHHRVRIATHPAFKAFVESEGGLEFFSVGGDPTELMGNEYSHVPVFIHC